MGTFAKFAASLLIAGACMAHAQTPAPPSAPIPAILSNTTRIFVANAGDQENADCHRAYNVFYAGLDELHRFTLVSDPAAADLIVELHYEIDLGASVVSDGGRSGARQFRAVLIEPRTHTLVWSLTERTNYAVRQANRDKNLDSAIAALVTDFGTLVSSQPTPPANKSKAPR
jgi:hypothetical protein